MTKMGVFKLEYRKIETKSGKMRIRKIFYFITERVCYSNQDVINLHREYSRMFDNYYICEWEQFYNDYVFTTKHRVLHLKPIQGIEQF